MNVLSRLFCRHQQMLRVRDERGYGAVCQACGYYCEVMFRSVQPRPKVPAVSVLAPTKSTPAKVIPEGGRSDL